MKLTIKDIAQMANVSKGTVSRVINNKTEGVSEETRQRILDIIDDVGYVPNLMARSIAVSETKTIGLVIPDVENPYFAQLVRGVEDCSMENGYTLFLCNSDMSTEKEKIYLKGLLEKRVDGIVLSTSGDFNDLKFKEKFYNINIPIILIDRKTKDLERYNGVFIDNIDAGYKATSYLLSGNYKDVAYIGGSRDVDTSIKRFLGYEKALQEHEIQVNENYVSYERYTIKSGYERTLSLMKKHDNIKGIFAGSDTIAIGVLKALKEMNISVPEEVEVVGIDNINASEIVSPSLTTVAQPIYDIGYQAAYKLIEFINNKVDSQDLYLPTEMVIRNSTRKRK